MYGLGLSGRAAARLLLAHGVAVAGGGRQGGGRAAISRRRHAPRRRHRGSCPPGVDLVVVSPGVPLDRPLLAEARAGAACR